MQWIVLIKSIYMAAAAAYYKKAAIVDFPCVVEGMRHMFSLIPLGSDIFDT